MCPHLDVQITHDLSEYLTASHRPIVGIKTSGSATERKLLVGFRRHGMKQKLEGCLYRFAVCAVVFLVSDATAIIHYTVKHESRHAFALIDPGRGLELFEIGGTDIKLPQFITALGLK